MKDFEQALNTIGFSLYTDEFAAKLLTWLAYGGYQCEACVTNPALNQAISICSEKAGLKAGQVMNEKIFNLMEGLKVRIEKGEELLEEIFSRYDLKKFS